MDTETDILVTPWVGLGEENGVGLGEENGVGLGEKH